MICEMTERDPDYLSAPRFDRSSAELRHIRDQADFYNAAPESWRAFYRLVPACSVCGWDQLRHDHMNLTLVCERCGARDTSDVLRAGRLANR